MAMVEFRNMAEPLVHSAQRCPNKTAVVFRKAELTYRELNDETNRLVSILRDKLHIVAGDKVAYLIPNGFDIVEVYYAIQKLGAVAVPLNCKSIASEINYLVNASHAKALVFDRQYFEKVLQAKSSLTYPLELGSVGGAVEGCVDFDEEKKTASAEEPVIVIDESALSRIQYTGGSTGLPKGAARTQHADLVELDGELESNGMAQRDDNVVLIQCPLEHHGGHSWFTEVFAAGATLIICASFNAEQILYKIEKYRVTYMLLLPPTTYMRLLSSPSINRYDLSSVRLLQSAAGVATKKIIRRIYECFPNAVLNYGWGQSESGLGTSLQLRRDLLDADSPLLNSVGTPMPHVEMKVVDDQGEEVPNGEIGEALFKGESMMSGYYDSPELTAKAFTEDGWLRTGDMMRRDDEGNYFVCARKKDMIKSGGENVFVADVERVLRDHPDVADCTVFGTGDPIMGEAVAAVVQLVPGSRLTALALQEWCKQYMSSYKKPRYIVFIDDMHRDDAGKIRKQDIIDYFKEHKQLVTAHAYRKVLDVPEVYAIEVPMQDGFQAETNAFLIKGEPRSLLVDTGIRQEKSREALVQSLDLLDVDRTRMDVFLTHAHADHVGLAFEVASPDSKIYLGREDVAFLEGSDNRSIGKRYEQLLRKLAAPRELIDYIPKAIERAEDMGTQFGKTGFTPVDEGDSFDLGTDVATVVALPGHTSGSCGLLLRNAHVLFLGDHIIMGATPNMDPFANFGNPIQQYWQSLAKVRDMRGVAGFSAHGLLDDQPYSHDSLDERIAQIEKHQLERVNEIVKMLADSPGLTGTEIATRITWHIPYASFYAAPLIQRWAIVLETAAYLGYAVAEKKLAIKEEEGVLRYFAR